MYTSKIDSNDKSGIEATLTFRDSNAEYSFFNEDVKEVKFSATFCSVEHLQIRMIDTKVVRFEVPVPFGGKCETRRPENPDYEVEVATDEDFYFIVRRKGTGNIILDTSAGGFRFEDRFLQLTTRLNSPNVYGIGENPHASFRHEFGSPDVPMLWPLFSRDEPPRDGSTNAYGVHPYHQIVEDDEGNSHGVLFLNSNAMDYLLFKDGSTPFMTWRSIGGIFDIHIFMGPTPTEVTKQYHKLIGEPMLPPYWALGFQLSRYGYNSLETMKEAVNRTREAGIPHDVQYADIDSMDARKDFTVDQSHWAELGNWTRQVKSDGLRFVIILRDFMLGKVWPDEWAAFPDFFKPETEEWWTEEIRLFRDETFRVEFDGIWIDMNEPANFGTNVGDSLSGDKILKCNESRWDDPPYLPQAARLPGGSSRLSDKTICMVGTHVVGPRKYKEYDVHSLFGLMQSGPTLRAARETTGARSFVISRSTYPSSGKYVGHWLGDNTSRWKDLHRSIIGMLEFNLFGIPYIGADICGFFGNTTEEMCLRWMQLGSFYPFSRNHNGLDYIEQDPGVWASVTEASKVALEIRYRFLPYLYTLFFRAHTEGGTVVRSLMEEWPGDSDARAVDTQFLWGDGFMVSPILELESYNERDIFIPPGVWYEYPGGGLHNGTKKMGNVFVDNMTVPIHLRGGRIFPTRRPARNTKMQLAHEPFGVVVALDDNGEATGDVYFDGPDGSEVRDPVALGNYVHATLSMKNNEFQLEPPSPDTVQDIFTSPDTFADLTIYGQKDVHALPVKIKVMVGSTVTEFTAKEIGDLMTFNNTNKVLQVKEGASLDIPFNWSLKVVIKLEY
ncbi:unnamed protein product [Cyprideis torosa]|uniref:Alpha-glucosidase n=1 Tax=Cyprideis torosa TaxID=163714 RepID=A0A7R8WH06_9CRUS|nr:unnamed protein product [Cyprideis torosa]CAG0892325.1 unnamed protein product [Cyprideis torosa]